ncbi:MAG: DUF4423 domain-containing protein, partial [Deltaproteobacteria bacterium]|nr:DUF4423 domain-containing protein [Deltaproteobacteria bacterium]
AISVSQAKKSVQLLLRLGLIEKDPTGASYVLTNRAISTPKDFFSLLGRNFHKEMGKKGIEALDTVAVEQRDVTGIVFGIPRDALQELKQRLGEFRKELTSTIGSMEQETDDVYYLNIQLFPVTKKEEQ